MNSKNSAYDRLTFSWWTQEIISEKPVTEFIDAWWHDAHITVFLPEIGIIMIVLIYGGAHGVMVNVVGNEHGDTSSNSGRYWLHFTWH